MNHDAVSVRTGEVLFSPRASVSTSRMNGWNWNGIVSAAVPQFPRPPSGLVGMGPAQADARTELE